MRGLDNINLIPSLSRGLGDTQMQDKTTKTKVLADGSEITVKRIEGQPEYVSLTDIAKRVSDDPNAVIQNWMRNRATIEYLGLWESYFNPNFISTDYESFRSSAGSNSFTMSPKKWIEATNAIGIESKAGRYGGTFAHYDIALEFMSWVSPAYKLHFLQEYQRLKGDEMQRQFAAKAQQVFLLPGHNIDPIITELPQPIDWKQEYEDLSEEDIINIALFGITQEQFEQQHPRAMGTVHNNSAISHIITHTSLRSKNSELISAGVPKRDRLLILNEIAVEQTTALAENNKKRFSNEISDQPTMPETVVG